jgi:hypothetical protein
MPRLVAVSVVVASGTSLTVRHAISPDRMGAAIMCRSERAGRAASTLGLATESLAGAIVRIEPLRPSEREVD